MLWREIKDVAGQFLLVSEKDLEVRKASHTEVSRETLAMVLMDSSQTSKQKSRLKTVLPTKTYGRGLSEGTSLPTNSVACLVIGFFNII